MRWISDTVLDHLRRSADLPEPESFPEPAGGWPEIPGGRYEIAAEIGQGGMGTVYLASDRELERQVALKVLGLRDPEVAGRMLREARILARLEHPGIVPVHDVGTLPDGRVYYVMRRVRGQHLDAFARSAARSEVLKAFERVLDAVAFAHAHGVIHRDLKPDNVMVGPFGDVLVMDWGVAKLDAEPAPAVGDAPGALPESPRARPAGGPVRTAHGTVLGTPGYMAPEQERGEVERTDQRADVYALGRMLRTLLAGAGGPVPRPLAGICARAAAAAPADRYASVEEMAGDLGRYLAGLPVGAYREGLLERAGRLARRHRTAIYLVLAYLLMRLLLLALLHHHD